MGPALAPHFEILRNRGLTALDREHAVARLYRDRDGGAYDTPPASQRRSLTHIPSATDSVCVRLRRKPAKTLRHYGSYDIARDKYLNTWLLLLRDTEHSELYTRRRPFLQS